MLVSAAPVLVHAGGGRLAGVIDASSVIRDVKHDKLINRIARESSNARVNYLYCTLTVELMHRLFIQSSAPC